MFYLVKELQIIRQLDLARLCRMRREKTFDDVIGDESERSVHRLHGRPVHRELDVALQVAGILVDPEADFELGSSSRLEENLQNIKYAELDGRKPRMLHEMIEAARTYREELQADQVKNADISQVSRN